MSGHLIGDIAKKLGVSCRTIRYYEERGLISSERSAGGFRVFADSQVEKLQTILTLKELGMPLDEIAHFIHLRSHGTIGSEVAPPLLQSLKAKVGEFKKAAERYKAMIKELETAISIIENCKTCNNMTEETVCEECMDKRTRHNVPMVVKALL